MQHHDLDAGTGHGGASLGLHGRRQRRAAADELRRPVGSVHARRRARRDRTRVLRATLLNRSVTIVGFSPQLALVRESRASNAQLYDYKRTRGELTFQRQFRPRGLGAAARPSLRRRHRHRHRNPPARSGAPCRYRRSAELGSEGSSEYSRWNSFRMRSVRRHADTTTALRDRTSVMSGLCRSSMVAVPVDCPLAMSTSIASST